MWYWLKVFLFPTSCLMSIGCFLTVLCRSARVRVGKILSSCFSFCLCFSSSWVFSIAASATINFDFNSSCFSSFYAISCLITTICLFSKKYLVKMYRTFSGELIKPFISSIKRLRFKYGSKSSRWLSKKMLSSKIFIPLVYLGVAILIWAWWTNSSNLWGSAPFYMIDLKISATLRSKASCW